MAVGSGTSDGYMSEAVGYIQAVESRISAMKRRLAVIQGKLSGCSCCPGRKT